MVPLILLLLHGGWTAAPASRGAAETQDNECLPRAREENYSCVCVCVWGRHTTQAHAVRTHTHTDYTETWKLTLAWCQTLQPACWFSPPCGCFPIQAGRSWVFLQADSGPLQDHGSGAVSITLTITGRAMCFQNCQCGAIFAHLVPCSVTSSPCWDSEPLEQQLPEEEGEAQDGRECGRMRKSLQPSTEQPLQPI